MNLDVRSVILAVLLFLSKDIQAWENHGLFSEVALSSMEEILKLAPVRAEPLEDFLIANETALSEVLSKEEDWAEKHVTDYPKIPESLKFRSGPKSEIQKRFLGALRVNPNAKFNLFRQVFFEPKSDLEYLPVRDITLLPDSLSAFSRRFVALTPGELVHPKDVFATATDEPDYGLDIGLWSDNKTPFGKKYGFGKQAFGNPKLEFSSQAPFHMGFFHESKILELVANGSMRSLVEYRIHQFYTLAQFAFSKKHEYWGWRFAGLGAHYIQDLTQPYHSTLMPGEGTLSLLSVGILDALGFGESKTELVEQASTEHLAIERFVLCNLRGPKKSVEKAPVQVALATNSNKYIPYDPAYVKNILTSESNAFADEIALEIKTLAPAFQPKSQSCPLKYSATKSPVISKLMGNLGVHTRSWIKSIGTT